MEEVIEIFGKRLKVVKEGKTECFCRICAMKNHCYAMINHPPCEDAKGKTNRHFELVND